MSQENRTQDSRRRSAGQQPRRRRRSTGRAASLALLYVVFVIGVSVLLAGVGWPPDIRTRTLDVHIQHLRRKLGPAARIETVFKVGYRLNA